MSARLRAVFLAGVVVAALMTTSCARGAAALSASSPYQHVPAGDAGRGEAAIQAYGCGACHAIPGVAGARGQVAPSLHEYGRRQFIVGLVPNTPDRLIQWIQDPSSLRRGTTMPSVGVTQQDARDIAAYLYRLD